MENLIEILSVIKSEGQQFETIKPRKDKVYELLKLIENGVSSEDEAMKLLFPEIKHPKTSFWKTKDRLYARIVNTLLITKNKNGTEMQNAYNSCYKNYAAYKILLGKGKSKSAVKLAKKGLKKAIQFDIMDLTFLYLKGLTKHYAYIEPDHRNYRKYLATYSKYKQVFDIENELEKLLWKITFTISVKKRFSIEELNFFQKIKDEALNLRNQASSFRIYLLSGNICAYYYQLTNNYNELITICNDCIVYFNSLPHAPAAAKFSFLFKMIPAYIKTGSFANGESAIKKCLKIAPKGHINYTRSIEYQVILNLHKGDYKKALKIANKEYKHDEEMFQILRAYAKLMNGIDIKLGKFLNEVPTYSKDKSGMNINLLIIQVLSYITRGDYSKVIDRLPALERYSYRYLKKDNTYRVNCFIHMLLLLEKGYFKKLLVNEHSKKLYKKLQKIPLSNSSQEIEVEPVPYEKLWEFILNKL